MTQDDGSYGGQTPAQFWDAQAVKNATRQTATPETVRANRYTVVRGANVTAAADLSPDLTARLQALLGDIDGAIMNARSAISVARLL
jgi:hypothetical protein